MTTLALNNSYSGGTFINNGAAGRQQRQHRLAGNRTRGKQRHLGPHAQRCLLKLPSALFRRRGPSIKMAAGRRRFQGPAAASPAPFSSTAAISILTAPILRRTSPSLRGLCWAAKAVSRGNRSSQNGAGIEAGQGGSGNLTVAGLLLNNVANININNLLSYSSTNLSSAVPAITVTGFRALFGPDSANPRNPNQPRRRGVLQHRPAGCPHPGVYRLRQPRRTGQSHRGEQSQRQHQRHQLQPGRLQFSAAFRRSGLHRPAIQR